MPLPKTKALLIADAEKERDALGTMLGGLTREQLLWQGAYGWSAKDFVVHLAEWERLFFGWYEAGRRGENPPVPAEGYTWATEAALNQAIFEQHVNDQLEHVMADWRDTSRRLIALTQTIAEADLLTPERYAWTGRGTLAAFINECGPNHYRWAMVEIKRGLKVKR
jgi:hypothetical protein